MQIIKKKYKVLVIDPPWNQGKTGKRKVRPNQTTTLDYPTMQKEELTNMPINEWSDDNSFLWIWVTNSKDRRSKEPIIKIGLDLMYKWGFTYYTIITWNKSTGPCPFGPYQVITEHLLFGYKGKVKFSSKCLGKMQTLFSTTPTMHSVKPDSFYREIAKYFEGPRLDIFARQQREGFDGWGNEYQKLGLEVKRPRSLKSNENNKDSF